MRWIFPILTAVLAILSIALDFRPLASRLVAPGSGVCAVGLCRFDQLYNAPGYAGIDATGLTPGNAAAMLTQDPSNPSAWCTYAESLAREGRIVKASSAFDHAITLGPRMPPILMRAANFEFSHNRPDRAFPLVRQILEQTPAFDQILFSYLTRTGKPAAELLGTAIPVSTRAAFAWLQWTAAGGSEQDLEDLWWWMKRNQLLDEPKTVALTSVLWHRGFFHGSQRIWADWASTTETSEPQREGYPEPEHLTNRAFEHEPTGSPFDWNFPAPGSGQVDARRDHGLDLRFEGTGNVNFAQVRQYTTVSPGRYRFIAEVSAQGLTSSQRPLFHVFDAVNPRRLDRETDQVPENAERLLISLDFVVPAGSEVLAVQIERHPGRGVDRNIQGTFHVYSVSLRSLDTRPTSSGNRLAAAEQALSETPSENGRSAGPGAQRLARRLASASAAR